MSELRDAIKELQAVVKNVSGIRDAPVDIPGELSKFPTSVAYPGTGRLKMGPPELMTGLRNVTLEVHVSLGRDLDKAVKEALAFEDSVPRAIFNAVRQSSFSTIQTLGAITYTFGVLNWGGVDTVGFRFVIEDVKIQSEIG